MNLRSFLRPGLLGLTALLASACATLKSDMENTCYAIERSGVRKTMTDAQGKKITEEEVLRVASEWVATRVKSTAGKNVWMALAMVGPEEQGNVLRHAAKEEAGLESCPFADELDAAYRRAQQKQEAEQQAKPPAEPSQPAQPTP